MAGRDIGRCMARTDGETVSPATITAQMLEVLSVVLQNTKMKVCLCVYGMQNEGMQLHQSPKASLFC